MKSRPIPQAHNLPFLFLGILTLLAAVWTGLIRLGWQLPLNAGLTPLAHGPLMVSGFLGMLIALERAVALGGRWPYLSPALTLLGAGMLLLGVPAPAGPLFMLLGSLGLLVLFGYIIHRHRATYTVTMGLGALAWVGGNLLWLLGRPIPTIVPWWMGFLILTILGERLELSRVMRPPPAARAAFMAAVALFTVALGWSLVDLDGGTRLLGASILALVLWLARWDVTRHTLRRRGMVRYIAMCMVLGYLWLLIGGVLALRLGGVTAGFHYDALLHAVFLGFVFSMIFGHALIIFPGLLGVPLPYRARLYVPLALLHGSLALRVTADLVGWFDGRRAGGLLNGVAILLFLAIILHTVRDQAGS